MDVTLRDVARAAGVHPSTASRALDPGREGRVKAETAALVRAVAEQLGYRSDLVARGLRRGRTGTVGIVVPDLSNPLFAPAIRGIENALDDREFMVLITESQDDPRRLERALHNLQQRRVDGLIVAAARRSSSGLIEQAATAGTPLVLAIRGIAGSSLPAVRHDDQLGGRVVARHFAELGHRRVAQLRGPGDIDSFALRAIGFSAQARSLGMDEMRLPEASGLPTDEEGARQARLLLESDSPPTAVFAHNDILALGVIRELGERGWRCPADMSVVGYNDIPLVGLVNPPLTTVRLPVYEVGRAAASLMLRILDNPDGPREGQLTKPELIVRGSTAPAPPASRRGSRLAGRWRTGRSVVAVPAGRLHQLTLHTPFERQDLPKEQTPCAQPCFTGAATSALRTCQYPVPVPATC
jgi:LacI family transcriptional regulator